VPGSSPGTNEQAELNHLSESVHSVELAVDARAVLVSWRLGSWDVTRTEPAACQGGARIGAAASKARGVARFDSIGAASEC
jgi:hypothetical protein